MRILYRYFWRWGDKSHIIYDLNVPGSRDDLRRVIMKHKNKEETKDIVHFEFFVIEKSITADEILAKIDSYPTHDPS